MEDMEPELAIFCKVARPPVMGLRHQPSHETYNLQSACMQDVLRNGGTELVTCGNGQPMISLT